MSNSSIRSEADLSLDVQSPVSVVRERATPVKGPLAPVPVAERTVTPARLEVEERELPFTD